MFKRTVISVIGLIIVWKLILVGLAAIVTPLIPFRQEFTPLGTPERFQMVEGAPLPYGLWVWANFDGINYLRVAARGYNTAELPFFPFYPLTIRAGSSVTGWPLILCGQVVSLVALAAALIVIAKLLKLDHPTLPRPLVFALILFFPTAFFYSAVYNDALFFFLSTLSIYWSRRRNWWPAALAGAAASLTRLNGLALLVLLIIEYLLSPKSDLAYGWNYQLLFDRIKKQLSPKVILSNSNLWAFILLPAALVGYLLYIEKVFGDWRLLFSAMATWQQDKPVLPIQVFYRYFKIFLSVNPASLVYWVAVNEFIFVFFYLACLIYSWRKIRLSYWAFVALSILVPATTGTFQGMPRYGLHLYPLYLILALWISRQRRATKVLYWIVTIALFMVFLTLFTHGYFVA